jgi:hypothetical protein
MLTSFSPYKVDDLTFIYNEIMEQEQLTPGSAEHIHRKVLLIDKFSKKYEVDTKIMTRLIRKESNFKRTAFNKNSKCRGLGQHSHRHWSHLLYYVDGGELGEHINKKGINNTTKYWYRISYSIEATAMTLKELCKNGYSNGLYIYGGHRIKNACPTNAQKYIDFILAINE